MARVRTRILELLSQMQVERGERISVAELHRLTGVSRQTIHRWMTGDLRRFDEDTIRAFCMFFNCEMSDLLYLDWNAPDPEA